MSGNVENDNVKNDNVKTTMGIYEAFGRGDVPAILEHLDDDVAWERQARDTGLPYLRSRRGRDEVAGFFTDLMANLELTHFEPQAFCNGGDTVAVPVVHAGRIVGGGDIPTMDEVHVWRFGPDGKVTGFQHVLDVAVHEQALAARASRLSGSTLHAVGDTIAVRRAGGAVELFEVSGPEGSGPPPHAHPWDEAYIGRTGTVEVTVDGATTVVGPGDTVVAPAGALHTYRIGDGGASFHVITSGARASEFFADLDASADHGAPTPESLPAIIDVARRHGLSSPLFA